MEYAKDVSALGVDWNALSSAVYGLTVDELASE